MGTLRGIQSEHIKEMREKAKTRAGVEQELQRLRDLEPEYLAWVRREMKEDGIDCQDWSDDDVKQYVNALVSVSFGPSTTSIDEFFEAVDDLNSCGEAGEEFQAIGREDLVAPGDTGESAG